MKIAYCGYDFFSASLRELLNAKKNIYRIFTVPNRAGANANHYVKELAQQFSIPVSEDRINEDTVQQLSDEGCDLLITAAYNYKIPSLESTGIKGINVHPSLLPQGRGEWPLPWVILTEQKSTGLTVHKLAEEYDAGEILFQKSFPVDEDETLESLSAKTQIHAKNWLPDVLNNFDQLWESAEPQKGDVSYWGNPSNEERTLNWQLGVDKLDRICRAFGKFGCYASFDGQQWMVYLLKAWKQSHQYTVGDVVHKTSTEMIVAASDGLVSLVYFSKLPGT